MTSRDGYLKNGGCRISLVFPPFDDKRDRSAYYVAPPLGLLYIAAALEAHGHNLTIHDFVFELKASLLSADASLYDQCAEKILSAQPDIVGFSTQCSTNPGSLNIARRLKTLRPALVILLGGHDVSFLAHDYLRAFPFVDFVLSGEAEHSSSLFVASIAGLRPLSDVPGVAYRNGGGIAVGRRSDLPIELDSLPPPSYHLVPDLRRYFDLSRVPTILIDSGRGCPFECEFCQTSLLTGHKVRYRSVPSLIAELKQYKEKYGTFEAYFVHDLFTARRTFVEELCHALLDHEINISWQCRCRLDQVDQQLLSLMKRSGCRMLLYGVESGSDKTLALMNKKLRPGISHEVRSRVEWTVSAGIFPSLSMVIGMPEEDLPDLNATMELAADVLKLGKVNSFIQLTSPLPGTPLATRTNSRLQYRGERAPTAFSQGIEFKDGKRLLEDEELIRKFPKIFTSFYVVPPDHGDLDLCIDVSLGYCKLLEVYCWTFSGLSRLLGCSALALFDKYRRYARPKCDGPCLLGVRDSALWNTFRAFAAELIDHRTPGDLDEIFRYEQTVHELAISEPIDIATCCLPRDEYPFYLAPGAALFRTHRVLPCFSRAESPFEGDNVDLSYLLMMTRDRLQMVRLSPTLATALDLLDELNDIGSATSRLYSKLWQFLKPLAPLGIFCTPYMPIEQDDLVFEEDRTR